MKNHIALKFLAILLCTVTLLGSILCVVGIAWLEQNELYEQDLDEMLEHSQERTLYSLAWTVAWRYAAQALGGCDELLMNELCGAEYWGEYGLRENSCRYMIRDAAGNVLLNTDSPGQEPMQQFSWSFRLEYPVQLEEWESEYEYSNHYGNSIISTLPGDAPSVLPTEHPSADNAELLPPDPQERSVIHIYDSQQGIYRAFRFAYGQMEEPWEVTVYLEKDAWVEAQVYDAVLLLWENRNNLFLYLALCLLLFAVGAVYLCTSAGRGPGSDEIRPRGFNALPLDLYTLGLNLGYWVALEVVRELGNWFSASYQVYFVFLLFLGFFCCLAFVSWCFAWAAQIKAGGGCWWRRTVLGIALLVVIPTVARTVLRLLRKLLGTLWRAAAWGLGHLRTGLTALVRFGWNAVKTVAGFICRSIRGLFRSGFALADRFFNLMPLIWQWLLTGFVLLAVLLAGLTSHDSRFGLVACALFLAVVLYGAYAFGTLMEASRRMSLGELDTKVKDGLLLGAFRRFAHHQNALADACKLAAQKEMRSERMKTELITNVSHDIKTPLTSIINYVDLLQKPHTEPEGEEYLEVLGRKSQQLKKLIEDLMELSKASTGNTAVNLRNLDPREAVTQALGEFSDKLTSARLSPVVKAPDRNLTVLADGRLTWRVLSNLLSNAVKYALPGTRLYVDILETESQVRVSVKNVSAQPLNMDAQELLERFVRGDASRNTEGSGLGLNIAQSLMQVQGGALELTVDGDLFKATAVFPKAAEE